MKKLSLTLPSAQSSTASLQSPLVSEPSKRIADGPLPHRRRPSVISLPNASTSTLLHRKDEDGDGDDMGSVPYLDGPVQILPGVWLGNEDNARDWRGLMSRGIRSILNVAKEVTCPIEGVPSHTLRSVTSHSDLKRPSPHAGPTYYPTHVASGRPGMHYLQLPWSHGQADLVTEGFPSAMIFVDQALERGDGILIHCQCGVSRSATLVIALVMRAATQCSPTVPPEVWALKTMHDAYSFVKEKSKWVGPNMSLIYQLLDYERALKPATGSPSPSEQSSIAAEQEWARRRQMVEEADSNDVDRESAEVLREARALDQAMEHRRISRKSSISSIASSNGIGMGQAWRSKYGSGRTRAGSVASVATTGSVLSEQLVEEDEEQELLGVGGGFAETSCSSAEPTEDEASSTYTFGEADSPDATDVLSGTPKAYPRVSTHIPPSAPAHKTSFNLPSAPATATATSFPLPKSHGKSKPRRRPPPLFGLLSPVPPSPITPICEARPSTRSRPETRRSEPRSASHGSAKYITRKSHHHAPPSATPAQTLFVFPPSPSQSAQTPSTMMLVPSSSLLKSPMLTPRIASFRAAGNRRSFIGVGSLATPTTACSRVDARGWVGMS
ncbi:dual specificity phosphatase domain-containing protein [Phanerochaete sordida]|uniref:protein-tyrosine-phosphatase n=1 Tax=Phanerochaete sordida TaxID=48140 RepID=A0A9P3L9T0_9APHY|nr:dual specificity phosphatase domain-containing protein [Phanerochaete sordida]